MQKAIKKWFPLFALPTLLAFALSFLFPFIMGLYLSFCKFKVVNNAEFVGLQNYQRAFQNQDFLNALWFTTKFTIVSVITINIIAFVFAMLLTNANAAFGEIGAILEEQLGFYTELKEEVLKGTVSESDIEHFRVLREATAEILGLAIIGFEEKDAKLSGTIDANKLPKYYTGSPVTFTPDELNACGFT